MATRYMNSCKLWLSICRYGSVRLNVLGAFALLVTAWAADAQHRHWLVEKVKCNSPLCTVSGNVDLWCLVAVAPC